MRTDGFIPAEKYGSQKLLHPEELGASPAGIRFIPSTVIAPWLNAATNATTTDFLVGGIPVTSAGYADVYPIPIFGEKAFGHLNLKSYKSMEVSVVRPGSDQAKSFQDMTGETGWVAADLFTGGGILDERRILRLECLASKTWA
jgi:N4-gp56 family major capsid protein